MKDLENENVWLERAISDLTPHTLGLQEADRGPAGQAQLNS